VTGPVPAARPLPPPSLGRRLLHLDPRWSVAFLITLVLVVAEAEYTIVGGLDRLASALGACLVTEVLLSRFLRGRWPALQSAYVSGISLTLLVKPQAAILWPFLLGGVLAIGSKYVITWRGRHLWNPSNFAICTLLLLAPREVATLSHQWGNGWGTVLVIWAFGLLIAWRARVLHVTLAYVASFLLLAVLRNAIVGGPLAAEIGPITGPMYQLFMFFMITDPRTTIDTRRGRLGVVVLIALAECAIRLAADFQVPALRPLYVAPPLFALYVVGPAAMAWTRPRRPRAPVAT
jgi:enediyne biosynthesis protein E5